MAVITQTTLSLDDTRETINAIKKKFPKVIFPPKEDICYATTNRQIAVKEIAKKTDLILVIGSENSSNSKRLAEVSKDHGTRAYLIDKVSISGRSKSREEFIATLTRLRLPLTS